MHYSVHKSPPLNAILSYSNQIHIFTSHFPCICTNNFFLRVSFDVELRLSPLWVGSDIGSTDATKTCHILNAYIFEINNHKVINNTSLDSS
jgi:hypothetical protein